MAKQEFDHLEPKGILRILSCKRLLRLPRWPDRLGCIGRQRLLWLLGRLQLLLRGLQLLHLCDGMRFSRGHEDHIRVIRFPSRIAKVVY